MNIDEKFTKTIDELKEKTVIVEGKKDAKALKALGIKNIIPVNGKPLIELVEEPFLLEKEKPREKKTTIEKALGMKKSEIVILTDFDPEGRRIAASLRRLLQRYKIKLNTRLRRAVMEIMAFENKNRIENMAKLENLRGDIHVKVSASFNKVHNKGNHKGKRSYRKTRCNRSNIRSD